MQVKSRMRGAAAVVVVLASVGVGALSQAGPAAAARATPAGPGGTWGQALAVPGVSSLGTGGTVAGDGYATAISCTSPGECTAVGSYHTAATVTWPLVVSQSGGAWGQAEALPGIAALSSGRGGKLTEISCASAGNCSATGTYDGPADSTSFAFLADEVDGTWGTVQPVPDAASLGTQSTVVNAISCPSAGNCAAVGTVYPPRSPRRGQWHLGRPARGTRPGEPRHHLDEPRLRLGIVRGRGRLHRDRNGRERQPRRVGGGGHRDRRHLGRRDRATRPGIHEPWIVGHVGVVPGGGRLHRDRRRRAGRQLHSGVGRRRGQRRLGVGPGAARPAGDDHGRDREAVVRNGGQLRGGRLLPRRPELSACLCRG